MPKRAPSVSSFPERFLLQRPQFGQLFTHFKDADFDNYAEPYGDLRDALRAPVPAWQEQFRLPVELQLQIPEEQPEADDFDSPVAHAWREWVGQAAKHVVHHPRLEEELKTYKALIDFERAGRHIYSIDPSLAPAFRQSQVGSLLRSEISLPYPCVYLHFGPQADIEYPLGHYAKSHESTMGGELDEGTRYLLDGAFVYEEKNHTLEILLTFCDPREKFTGRPPVADDYRFPVFAIAIDFGSYRGGALERSLDEGTLVFSDTWDSASGPGELEFGRMRELLAEGYFEYESEQEEYELFNPAITLIANALRYINQSDGQPQAGIGHRIGQALTMSRDQVQ